MQNSIRITVPKPCHEKWNSFTKTSDGGFCSSCQKEVVDFTSWSDERIKSYFKNLKGNGCGRFRPDQLKVYAYEGPSRRRISWISFVFAGFLLLFSSRQVSAQAAPKNTTDQYMPEEKNNEAAKSRLTAGHAQRRKEPMYLRPVTGLVIDAEQGVPLSGVMVTLKGTSKTTTTDAEGKFTLELPHKDSSQFIVFSLRGFKTLEYLHNVTRPGQEIGVEMTRHELDNIQNILGGMVGGVVVSKWYEPREIARDVWWWLTGR
jgi:hypothetical protein